jgi:hypothetical protein
MTFFLFQRATLRLLWAAALLCTLQRPGHAAAIAGDTVLPKDRPNWAEVAAQAQQINAEAGRLLDSFNLRHVLALARNAEAEALYQAAKADTASSKDVLANLKTYWKQAQRQAKTTEKHYKSAEKTALSATALANADSATQLKNLPKCLRQVERLRTLLQQPAAPKPAEAPSAAQPTAQAPSDSSAAPDSSAQQEKPRKKRPEKPKPVEKPTHKRYDPATDVLLNPPQPPCALGPEQRDAFSGETRQENLPAELFRHTNTALRRLYTDRPHTLGELSFLRFGLNAALNLRLRVNDPNARRTQGTLPKNAVAVFRFVDGSTLSLNNQRNDDGQPSADNQSLLFAAQFLLDKAMLKKFRSVELDKIRLNWSNGYEDYDVQQLDLPMRQINCLWKD